jgi:hypothetical protein
MTLPGIFDIAVDIATQLSCYQIASAVDGRNDALDHWCIPGTDISIVCNQEAAIHREDHLEPMTYSLVSTFGSYTRSRFQVPDLNFHCQDSPGTVMIGMTGLFAHGIARGDGNRITLTVQTPRSTLEETDNIVKNNCSNRFLRSSPISLSTYDAILRCDPRV